MKKSSGHISFFIAALFMLLYAVHAQAQLKLGNHPTRNNKSALLELESPNQGLLLTRIADTDAVNILDPPDGMIIYFTDGSPAGSQGRHAGMYERKNGAWKKVGLVIDTAVDKSQSAIKFTYKNDSLVLHLPNATTNLRGVMSTGRQTFSGRKTFRDSIVLKNLHPGSIVFVRDDPEENKDALTDNNGHLFWDDNNFRLGIGSNTPVTNLDVNGNFKLGENGSALSDIIRDSLITESGLTLNAGEGYVYTSASPYVEAGASIITSPAGALPDGVIIAYSYTTAGTVYIKIQNAGPSSITIPESTTFYFAIIQ